VGRSIGSLRAQCSDSRDGAEPSRVHEPPGKCLDRPRGPHRAGIVANVERARRFAEASPSIVTPLNRVIGYENAAKIAKHSVKAGITVREAVIDLGFVERGEITEEQLDALLDVTR